MDNEYVPGTSRVRVSYVNYVGGTTWYEGKADALVAQFDRWLAKVERKARRKERERIIAMFQVDVCVDCTERRHYNSGELTCYEANTAIARIERLK